MSLSRRTLILRAAAGAAVLPALTLPARAAEQAVSIAGMAFNPADLTIAAGDSVTFTNNDNAPHTATADNGAFDTGRMGNGQSATLTFPSAGSYAYHCAVHPMMKGTITVT